MPPVGPERRTERDVAGAGGDERAAASTRRRPACRRCRASASPVAGRSTATSRSSAAERGESAARRRRRGEDVGAERRAEVDELLGERPTAAGRVVVDRHPDARGDVDIRRGCDRAASSPMRMRAIVSPQRLRRVEQRQTAVGDLADELDHPRRHRAEVDRRRRGRASAAAPRCPIRPAARDVGRAAARHSAADRDDRLPRAPQRCRAVDPGPAEEVGRRRRRDRAGSGRRLSSCSVAAAIAISAGCIEYGLSTHVPSADRGRRRRRRREHHRRRPEEQVVRHPDLVEPERLGDAGELDELVDADVVVQRAGSCATTDRRSLVDHRVELDLDEEVVTDQRVHVEHRVRRADRSEHLGVGPGRGRPVGVRHEVDRASARRRRCDRRGAQRRRAPGAARRRSAPPCRRDGALRRHRRWPSSRSPRSREPRRAAREYPAASSCPPPS